MSVVAELENLPGVIAAGENSCRGDRYSFKGQPTDELAHTCVANNAIATMQPCGLVALTD